MKTTPPLPIRPIARHTDADLEASLSRGRTLRQWLLERTWGSATQRAMLADVERDIDRLQDVLYRRHVWRQSRSVRAA